MGPSEIRKVAAASPWLVKASPSFREAVLARCQVRRYEDGVFIQNALDDAGGIYGVVEGSVRLMLAAADHGPYCGHLLLPGGWIGEGPAITGGPRLVSLISIGDSTLLWLSRSAIGDIAALDGAHWRQFVRLMSSNLDLALGAIADLMLRDHRKRLVAALLRVAGRRSESPPGDPPVTVPLTQSDIATMANVTRTTAGSTLRALERAGWLTVAYGRVTLLASERMRESIAD